VLEYLNSIQRQAQVLILRNVRPEYWAPLGVWIIRETVRNGFDSYEVLEDRNVKDIIGEEFRFQYSNILDRSKLMGGKQSSLLNY